MSETEHILAIHKILVALDASPHGRAALEAAVELARRFQAQLEGLYVEDENLLRAAELPFLQEIGLLTASSRQVAGEAMQRQIRGQSRTVRRLFSGTSQRAHVHTEFHIVRGQVLPQVLSAAAGADMLVLGRIGGSMARRGKLGSTVRGILPEPFGMALIVQAGARPHRPLAVLYDGSPQAERALAASNMLNGQETPGQLLLVLLAPNQDGAAEMRRHILASYEGSVLPLRFSWLPAANPLQLAAILLAERTGTLVLPAHVAGLPAKTVVSFLEQLELPILLVT